MNEYRALWNDTDGEIKVLSGKFISLPLYSSQTHIDWPEPRAFIVRGL